MRIDKARDTMATLKEKLTQLFMFAPEVSIYRILLKPRLEVVDDVALLEHNDRLLLDLFVKVKRPFSDACIPNCDQVKVEHNDDKVRLCLPPAADPDLIPSLSKLAAPLYPPTNLY